MLRRRLLDDWRELADELAIPVATQRRFEHGDEVRGIWDWLAKQERINELPEALHAIDRSDLATELIESEAKRPSN